MCGRVCQLWVYVPEYRYPRRPEAFSPLELELETVGR